MNEQARPRTRRLVHFMARGAVWAFALLGAVFTLVTLTPIVHWYASTLAGPWQDPSGDVLIVLGADVLDDGTMGVSSYWRGYYALRVWQEGRCRKIVVTGGGNPRSSAEAIAEFLKSQGVPAEAITLETRAQSTHENALLTKDLLAGLPGAKVLLTSDYHMFRAYRAFRKVGIEVLPRPFPDARKRAVHWASRWPAFLDLANETVKIAYYYSRGLI